jgi:hypothetical protein
MSCAGYSPLLKTTAWRQAAFDFCKLTVNSKTSYCSVISFQAFSPTIRSVSDYKYQLLTGLALGWWNIVVLISATLDCHCSRKFASHQVQMLS